MTSSKNYSKSANQGFIEGHLNWENNPIRAVFHFHVYIWQSHRLSTRCCSGKASVSPIPRQKKSPKQSSIGEEELEIFYSTAGYLQSFSSLSVFYGTSMWVKGI